MVELNLANSDEDDIKINKSYANKYTHWREKEELQKLKDKFSSSSDASSEDEEASRLTSKLDEQWMRLYSMAKLAPHELYDRDVSFFDKPITKKVKRTAKKKLFFKDLETKAILGIEDQLPAPGSYAESQIKLKEDLKKCLNSGSDDELLTKAKTESDSEEHIKFLKSKSNSVTFPELESLRSFWQSDKLSDKDKFMRDYLLNKKYIVKEDVPLESSEEDGDEFERQYNLRSQEVGGCEIRSFPRKVKDSVRPVDDRRVKARERTKEKREAKERSRQEEKKRLRSLQRRAEKEKLEKLRRVSGLTGFDETFLDDFDPDDYDNKMERMFGDDFYSSQVTEKPVFSEEEEEVEQRVVAPSKRSLRRMAEKERRMVPEDTIAPPDDRFAYRQVTPCDYGLSMDEVLNAENAELNRWVSLRKVVRYGTEEEERAERSVYARRRERAKRHTFPSLYEGEVPQKGPKKRKGGDERLVAYGIDPKKFKFIKKQ